MKILNIHGYGSNPYNGLYHALQDYGFTDILTPTFNYDKQSPGEVWLSLLSTMDKEHPDIVTGSSLGGFFASLISAVRGTRAVLVNPCLVPQITLPKLDFKERDFVREYMQLAAHLAALENAYAILGGQDELIGYHDFTRWLLPEGHSIIVPEGGHRGSTLPLKELLQSYGETFFSI